MGLQTRYFVWEQLPNLQQNPKKNARGLRETHGERTGRPEGRTEAAQRRSTRAGRSKHDDWSQAIDGPHSAQRTAPFAVSVPSTTALVKAVDMHGAPKERRCLPRSR